MPICSGGQGSATSTDSRAMSKPKPGSNCVGERVEPLDEQRADFVPDRARGASSRRRCGAASPSVRNNVSSMRRAPSPRRSSANLQPRRQPRDGAEHVLLARDRLGKTLLGDIRRDRQPRIERLVLAPERAVELAQQFAAEAGGERARGRSMISPMRFKPTRASAATVSGGSRSAASGSGDSNVALLAARITCRLAIMRGGVGRADAAGDGDAIGKAGLLQPLAEIGDQRRFAAVKMRAAADVEQQAVGRIAGHQRRVAQAPVGDVFEQGGVGFGVFLDRLERRMHGARLRQRHAGREAKPFRRVVDGDDQLGIAALAVDGNCFILRPKGAASGNLTRPFDAVGREPAQPQAEHARG